MVGERVVLSAKNEKVAKFWEKCGFRYEGDPTKEISMYYMIG